MMRQNIAIEKSKAFALRIVRLHRYLCDEKHEYVLSNQLLRSGTSIGANLAESVYASTRKDFVSKVYIALKECAETAYWLDLIHDSEYLNDAEYQSIAADCKDILYILRATTKTIHSKENPKRFST